MCILTGQNRCLPPLCSHWSPRLCPPPPSLHPSIPFHPGSLLPSQRCVSSPDHAHGSHARRRIAVLPGVSNPPTQQAPVHGVVGPGHPTLPTWSSSVRSHPPRPAVQRCRAVVPRRTSCVLGAPRGPDRSLAAALTGRRMNAWEAKRFRSASAHADERVYF